MKESVLDYPKIGGHILDLICERREVTDLLGSHGDAFVVRCTPNDLFPDGQRFVVQWSDEKESWRAYMSFEKH